MIGRGKRKSKRRAIWARTLAALLTFAMLFTSSGFQVLASEFSADVVTFEQASDAEAAMRAQAAADAEAARLAAEAQASANAGAGGVPAGISEFDTFDIFSSEPVEQQPVFQAEEQEVKETKLVLKTEENSVQEEGEFSKLKVTYELGKDSAIPVETRMYIGSETVVLPQFDEEGKYVNPETGRIFLVKQTENGELYVEYMLQAGENFTEEFQFGDSMVEPGSSVEFNVVISAHGDVPADHEIQATPAKVIYALPKTEEPPVEETPAEKVVEEETSEEEPAAEVVEEETSEEEPTEEVVEEEAEEEPTEEVVEEEAEEPTTEEVVEEEITEIDTEEVVEEPVEEEEAEEVDIDEFVEYGTSFVYEDSRVQITATAFEGANIPKEAVFRADYLPVGSDAYNEAVAAIQAQLGDVVEGEEIEYVLYDMYFDYNGTRIEPEDGLVEVIMNFKTTVVETSEDKEIVDTAIIHIEGETGVVEDLTETGGVEIENGEVTSLGFTTDSFSIGGGIFALGRGNNTGVMLLGSGDEPSSYNIADGKNSVSYRYFVDGSEYTGGVISRDSEIDIVMTYSFHKDNQPTTEYYKDFYYVLPDISGIVFDTTVTEGEILDPLDYDVGDFKIDVTNKKVYFEYDPNALVDQNGNPKTNFKGTFTLYAKVDKDSVAGSDEIDIMLPGAADSETIYLQSSTVTGVKSYVVADDGTLLFTINLTANSADAENVVVTDRLNGPFSFIENSFEAVATKPDGTTVDVSDLEVEFQDGEGGSKVAIITVGKVKYNEPVTITYKVKPTAAGTNLSGSNTAEIGWGNEGTGTGTSFTGDVSIDLDNTVLSKDSVVLANNNQIKYTVKVNELGADLDGKTGGTIKLVDTIDTSKVSLMLNSIKVTDNKGVTITNGVNINYDTEIEDKPNTAELNIEVPDEKALIITYNVRVKGEKGDSFSVYNKINMKAPIEKEDDDSKTVVIQSATATFIGDPGTITLYKVGKYKIGNVFPYLEDAKFGLYRIDLNANPVNLEGTLIGTESSDSNGKVVFGDIEEYGLLERNVLYYFKEIEAPEGYYIPNEVKTYFYVLNDDIEKNRAFDKLLADKGISSAITVNKYKDTQTLEEYINEKIPTPTTAGFEAEKNLIGAELTNGEFSFKMSFSNYQEGNYKYVPSKLNNVEPKATSYTSVKTNDLEGKIVFDQITFEYEGTYTFIVEELEDINGAFYYDGTTYTVTYLVERGADGNLHVVSTLVDGRNDKKAEFTNIAFAELSLTKKTNENVKKDTVFEFTVTGSDFPTGTDFSKVSSEDVSIKERNNTQFKFEVIVEEGSNTKTVAFDGIPVGVKLSVSETKKTGWYVTTNSNNLVINSAVADTADNVVENTFVVENEYRTDAEWVPNVRKDLQGRDYLTGEVFTYKVFDSSTPQKLIAVGKNDSSNEKVTFFVPDANGNATTTPFKVVYNQTHADKEFVYTISEDKGNAKGLTYDSTVYEVTVSVSDNGEGVLSAEAVYKVKNDSSDEGASSITFVNVYEATGKWKPAAKKLLSEALANLGSTETFTFKLLDKNNQELSTGTVNGAGEIIFDKEIEYNQDDVRKEPYEYKLVEVKGSKAYINYDKTEYTVKVWVSDNGDGSLAVVVKYYNGKTEIAQKDNAKNNVIFTNGYQSNGEWVPTGTKNLIGRDYKSNERFAYIVTENGQEVSRGTSGSDGVITFTPIEYTQDTVGKHNYVISELYAGQTKDGITYDSKTYAVEVDVRDDGDGTMTITADYADDVEEVSFTNIYRATGTWTAKGNKNLVGRSYKENEKFDYEIYEIINGNQGATPVATASNNANGDFEFSDITYTLDNNANPNAFVLGKHFYKIFEVKGNDKNIDYDTETVYTVEVTVEDKGDGTLKVSPVWTNTPGSKAAFTNRYYAKGDWTLTGTKEFTGRDYKEGETFSYVIKEGGITVANGTSDASGKISFTPIEYEVKDDNPKDGVVDLTASGVAVVGNHIYTVHELPGESNKGIDYDDTVFTIKVNVTDDKNGKLTPTIIEGPTTVAFNNTYRAVGEWDFTGTKSFLGRLYEDNEEFLYEIYENGVKIANGESDASGEIDFDTISYVIEVNENGVLVNTTPLSGVPVLGDHTYTIKEVNSGKGGITYDPNEFTLTVTVSDNEDGTLSVVPKGDHPEIAFENSYRAEGKFTLSGTKVFTGRDYEEGETFSYVIKEGETTVATGTSGKDGIIHFEDITYVLEDTDKDGTVENTIADTPVIGEHYYTVKEVPGKNTGITYDEKSFVVKVRVSDNKNGTLNVIADVNNPVITFNNSYEAKGEWTPEATKELIGRDYLTGEDFNFVVLEVTEDGNGNTVETEVTNAKGVVDGDDEGIIRFGKITYGLEDLGLHTYKIYEVNEKDPGLSYDQKIVVVHVNVTDKASGALQVDVDYQGYDEENGQTVVFTNTYNARGSWKPVGTKHLVGREYKSGEIFVYQIKEKVKRTVMEKGEEVEKVVEEVVSIGYNLTDGSIFFPEINYTQEDVGEHKYTINEVVSDFITGIAYDKEVFEVTVNVTDKGNGYLEATASYPEGGVSFVNKVIEFYVNKVDLTGNEEVEDAELTVYDSRNNVVDSWISKKGEVHDFGEKLKAGENYKLVETIAPNGYTYAATVEFSVGNDGEIIISNNTPLTKNTTTIDGVEKEVYLVKDSTFEFKVDKVDITGTEEVDGAQLEVRDSNDVVIYSWESKKGIVHDLSSELKAGETYKLVETSAPKGYGYAVPVTFTISKDGTIITSLTKDEATGAYLFKDAVIDFKVNKVDITGKEEIPGATLQVRDSENNVVDSWTSKKGDKPHDFGSKLEAGKTYTLVETSAPEGYAYISDIKFTVEKDGTITVDRTKLPQNEDGTYLVKDSEIEFNVNKVDLGGKDVSGANLAVLDKNGRTVDSWTSKAGETYDFGPALKAGESYTLVELEAPAGFAKAASIKFTVGKDGTITTDMKKSEDGKTYLMEDEELHFNVNKVELGSGKEVEGARLEVIDKSGTTLAWWESKANETKDFGEYLTAGETYVLRETVAPEGYAFVSDISFEVKEDGTIVTGLKRTVDADGNETYLVEDSKLRFNVNKVDVDGGEEIEGATLAVYQGDKLIEQWESKDNETHNFGPKLTAGETYTLKETFAPIGYAFAKEIEFTVEKDGSIKIGDKKVEDEIYLVQDKKLEFKVNKVDLVSEEEVAGATFEVHDAAGEKVAEWTSTGGEGYDFGYALNAGESYTLVETSAPIGYAYVTDIPFTVAEDGTIEVNLTSSEDGTYLVKDERLEFNVNKVVLGGTEEVEGARLEVHDENGNVVASWESKANETHDFGSSLEAGKTYTLVEADAPEGYAYAESIEFTVEKDGTITTDMKKSEDGTTYLMEDAELYINVNKVDITGTEEVEGATLEVRDSSGNLVASWTSKAEETFEFGDVLKAGESYTLVETNAPVGYTYIEPISFKVEKNGAITVDVEKLPQNEDGTYLVKDDSIEFHVNKVDLVSGEEIEGAKLQVLDENNIVVESWESKANEPHDFGPALKAGKTYRLVEVEAPTGYAYFEDVLFEVAVDGEITILTEDAPITEANGIYSVADEKLEFNVNKVDLLSKEEVEGATIEVQDKDGNTVASWISEKDKTVDFGYALNAGETYKLVETIAPQGYRYTVDIEFTVNTDGTIDTEASTITDEAGNTVYLVEDEKLNLHVSKIDLVSRQEVPGASLELRDSEGKVLDSWVSESGKVHDIGGLLVAGESYVLVETGAPTGYAFVKDIKFTVEKDGSITTDAVIATDEAGKEVLFVEDERIDFYVNKVDLVDNVEVAGATLQVLDADKNVVDSWVSAVDEVHDFGPTLEAGKSYTLVEAATPAGYAYVEDIPFTVGSDGTITVDLPQDEDGTYLVKDEKLEFHVKKVELGTSKEVEGAVLTVYDKDGKEVYSWTSKADETVDFGPYLIAGETYTLVETVAPKGYAYVSEIEFTVEKDGSITTEDIKPTVDEAGKIVYLVEDAPLEMHVNKVELGSSKEVEGAVIEVRDKDNKVVTSWTSKAGETVDFGKYLTAGESYTLVETVAPTGFAYTNTIPFTVGKDGTIDAKVATTTDEAGNVVYLVEDDILELNVNKVELGSGKEVAGAVLELRDSNDKLIDSWTSREGETHDFGSKLNAGETYTLVETVAPQGYAYTTDIEFTVNKDGSIVTKASKTVDEAGNVTYLVKDNKLVLNVSKVELGSGKEVAGAKFELLNSKGIVVDTWTSEEGKTHDFGSVLYAGESYTLVETVAPQGYAYTTNIEFTVEKDGTIVTTASKTVDKNGNVTYLVADAKLELNVNKVDLTTEKEVAGATLELRDSKGNVVDSWVSEVGKTHDFGSALKAGETFTLVETVAPEGYTYTTDIKFAVTNSGAIITTGRTTVDENDNVTYLVEDAPIKATISKVDIADESKELVGASMQIMDAEGKEIVKTIYGEELKWVSAEEPKEIAGLPAGKYILRETAAPDGYTIAEDIEFTVSADMTIENKVVMKNVAIRLEITKTGFTKDNKVVPLKGAMLEIRETKEDGGIGDIAFNVYGEKMRFESAEEAIALNGVKPGKYWLVETDAPDGYAIAEPIQITINEDMTVSQNPVTAIMEDCPIEVEVSKVDITTGEELPGATLQILTVKEDGTAGEIATTIYYVDDETTPEDKLEWVSGDAPRVIKGLAEGNYILREITAPAGYTVAVDVAFTVDSDLNVVNKVVMEDAPTEIVVSKTSLTGLVELEGAHLEIQDEEGNVVTTVYGEELSWVSGTVAKQIKGLPAGNYTLVETQSPDGYAYADDVEFTVTDKVGVVKVSMKDDTTKVEISKYDVTNEKELAGAHLILKDSEGTIVADWISNGTPKVLEGELIAGEEYTLSEVAAPVGYAIAKDITFTVNMDGTLQKVVMEDEVAEGKGEIVVQKIVMQEGKYIAVDYTFYTALFADEDCTERVTSVKPLYVSGSYTTSTIFTNLPYGTYYVAETDEFGNLMEEDSIIESIQVIDGKAELLPSQATAKSTIINHVAGFDDHFYKSGEIVVNKSVVNADGEEVLVDDTFYFALFTDAALTNMADAGIVELKLSNASEGVVIFSDLPLGIYYLAETDEDGVPVGSAFEYTVTVDSSYCKLDEENPSVERTIVNQTEEEPPAGTPTPTPTPPGYNPPGGNPPGDNPPTSVPPVKTGDDTPVLPFAAGASASLLAAIWAAVLVLKRRRRNG